MPMKKKQKSEFMQGFACAVSSLVVGHGDGTVALELVGQIGTYEDAVAYGVDPYDLKILKNLFKQNAERKVATEKMFQRRAREEA